MKKLLAIQGGGILLKYIVGLLAEIQKDLDKDLLSYFDGLSGTSAGSLAIGGVLNFPAMDLPGLVSDTNCLKIFDFSFWDRQMGIAQSKPQFDGLGLREVIQENFQNKLLGDYENKIVVIPIFNLSEARTNFIRNTDPIGKTWKLSDAILCSSSAPAYFPPVKINDKFYCDGGVSCNNPVLSLYSEARKTWGFKEEIKVLNILTGNSIPPLKHEINPSEWGLFDYVLKGNLIPLLMDESPVVHYCQTLLGNDYVVVNPNIETGKTRKMDNVEESNLRALEELGIQTYKENKEEILRIITE